VALPKTALSAVTLPDFLMDLHCKRRLRRACALVLSAYLLAVALPASPAAAAGKTARQQRQEVQKKKAEVAGQINLLAASNAQVAKALDALAANVRAQQARVAAGRQASAVAQERLATAKSAEARTTARLADLRTTLQQTAVEAYVRGPAQPIVVALGAADFNEVARRDQMLRVAIGQGTDVADELRATREDLGIKRQEADAAKARADEQRRQLEAGLKDLKTAQSSEQKVADGVERRLNDALAEAQALEAVDKALAAQMAAEQAAIARRLASQSRGRVGTFVGSRRIGTVAVTSVRGIVVATSIAGAIENLLAAAESDGFVLSGGGFRDPQQQVELRRAHCGSSDYAIYDAPASSCHPPTAQPGSSMHEQGLAIDFTSDGRLITSRSNPAFAWLRSNAGRFGLTNLPSEPWHWSSNGR